MSQSSDETPQDLREAGTEPESDTARALVQGGAGLRRRRLLKGLVSAGAGVPVILTLTSGAALAASSTTCLENQTEIDDEINGTQRCVTQNAIETQVRARRNSFTGWTGAMTAATEPIDGNGMTGGSNTANDLCLVYHYPHGHASQGVAASPANNTNNWGKDGTNVRINMTCWNSLVNS